MRFYYTSIIFLSIAILMVLGLLVHENGRIKIREKHRFYQTYLVIGLTALSEWGAIMLNGAPDWTYQFHVFTKCADYILSPLASVLFVRQLGVKSKLEKYMLSILLVNVVLEIVSAFTGMIYTVDPVTNEYAHGSMYVLYVIVFVLAFLYIMYEFFLYGKQYKKQNRASVVAIIALAFAAVIVQEGLSDGPRIIYIGMAAASALAFIHFSEFSQQRIDEDLSRQKLLLDTDILTGMLSRYAYTEHLNRFKEDGPLPSDLVMVAADINGLKEINDSLGHEAGDELIRGAAECILKEMNPYGKCFRTGGDEFVAILEMDSRQIQPMLQKLDSTVSHWHGRIVQKLSVSVGFSVLADKPDASAEELIGIADKRMYENKAAYYKQAGNDRRVHR